MAEVGMAATVLREYQRFSLYNSPYQVHDSGCAIDLYPTTNEGVSPVAGDVLETRTVRAPPKPYAADDEYLILVDVDAARSGLRTAGVDPDGLVARILHVRPDVEPGDTVAVGDSLGTLLRSGFFAPWVENHVHVGFRGSGQNLLRAQGSLAVAVDVDVDPVPWSGVGTVIKTGDTYVRLDTPDYPSPRDRFAGIAGLLGVADESSDARRHAAGGQRAVLDGGLAHYAGGGVLGTALPVPSDERTVTFLDHPVGDLNGRNVTWSPFDVVANGERITGLSLFAGLGSRFGAKLVCPDRSFAVGDRVRVRLRDSDDPIRLG